MPLPGLAGQSSTHEAGGDWIARLGRAMTAKSVRPSEKLCEAIPGIAPLCLNQVTPPRQLIFRGG
jgi:hypothetical protein